MIRNEIKGQPETFNILNLKLLNLKLLNFLKYEHQSEKQAFPEVVGFHA